MTDGDGLAKRLDGTTYLNWKAVKKKEGPPIPLSLDLLNTAAWDKDRSEDRPPLYWTPGIGLTSEPGCSNVLTEDEWMAKFAVDGGVTENKLRSWIKRRGVSVTQFVMYVLSEREKLQEKEDAV